MENEFHDDAAYPLSSSSYIGDEDQRLMERYMSIKGSPSFLGQTRANFKRRIIQLLRQPIEITMVANVLIVPLINVIFSTIFIKGML